MSFDVDYSLFFLTLMKSANRTSLFLPYSWKFIRFNLYTIKSQQKSIHCSIVYSIRKLVRPIQSRQLSRCTLLRERAAPPLLSLTAANTNTAPNRASEAAGPTCCFQSCFFPCLVASSPTGWSCTDAHELKAARIIHYYQLVTKNTASTRTTCHQYNC